MATPLCRSWKSLEVDGRLQIPRHLETQGGLSSIAFKSSRFFSPNFVETRKGNGFAQLCRRHFVCSFGSEERRAAALEPQMATPGFKDLQFSCQKIQCAAIMARSAGTSKNPVGYCLLASDATYIYILSCRNLEHGYGQARLLCLPSMPCIMWALAVVKLGDGCRNKGGPRGLW